MIEAFVENWAKERPDVDTSAKGVVYAIHFAQKALLQNAEKALREFGIRFGEYQLLACMRRDGAPYSKTPGDLSRLLGLTSGGVSQILRKLDDKGLVTRDPLESDQRQVIVTLTSKGLALVEQAFEKITERENVAMSSVSEEQKQQLRESLEILLSRLGDNWE